jgi:hypothetical protein
MTTAVKLQNAVFKFSFTVDIYIYIYICTEKRNFESLLSITVTGSEFSVQGIRVLFQ